MLTAYTVDCYRAEVPAVGITQVGSVGTNEVLVFSSMGQFQS